MDSGKQKELADIQKRMRKINILASPGAILLGLGLYGKFGARGDAFISALNDPFAVNLSLLAGAVITVWEFTVVFRLLKRKAEIMAAEKQHAEQEE